MVRFRICLQRLPEPGVIPDPIIGLRYSIAPGCTESNDKVSSALSLVLSTAMRRDIRA